MTNEAANERQTMSLWYAFGQLDSGNWPSLRAVDAAEFSREQRDAPIVSDMQGTWIQWATARTEKLKADPPANEIHRQWLTDHATD